MRTIWAMGLVVGCTTTTPPTTTDSSPPSAPSDTDWATELPGIYEGEEESPTIGTIRATFEVAYDEGQARFDVYFAPGGTRAYPKVYFEGVEPGPQPWRGFVVLPEQIYAEGQTGPNDLILRGAGTVDDGFDGRVNLEAGRIVLQATIESFAGPEPFTLTLTR